MTYAFVFVNFAMEEGLESLDIPKVFLHKKDAMKEFEKRKAELLESYEGFEDDWKVLLFYFCTIYKKK